MSDAMSFTEVDKQYVELLPPRTVLSMLRATAPGPKGDAGAHGPGGKNLYGFGLLGMIGWSPDLHYNQVSSDNGSTTEHSHR
jgi:hypothetical protein